MFNNQKQTVKLHFRGANITKLMLIYELQTMSVLSSKLYEHYSSLINILSLCLIYYLNNMILYLRSKVYIFTKCLRLFQTILQPVYY